MGSYVKTEEQFESLGNQLMLSKVDKLRELNIGSIVPLPQLVVVGDQSSGKSSVLESLTSFSFPRATTLCTRYATQITCKRQDVQMVDICIMAGPNASPTHKERLAKFHRRSSHLEDDELANTFVEANIAMGIRSGASDDGNADDLQAFSEDILKIEMCGPNESHLTVIDVPGIFRASTQGVTTDEDIILVKEMVKKYMKDPRTIILAVIPCNVDIATQEILRLAQDADPNGVRTMGVLTKPDLAVERATQQDAIDLVKGQRNRLHLGYCVVKNRGADDTSSTLKQRNKMEHTFFSQGPWSQLADTERTGIEALRKRLRELLMGISKKELPLVKAEIQKLLRENQTQYNDMGPSRASTDAQRIYLGKLSDKFQRVTQYALDAYYTRDDIFQENFDMRLITRILELNEVFAEVFARRSHTRYFKQSRDDDKSDEAASKFPEQASFAVNQEDFPEIRDILADKYECPDPKSDSLLKYIEEELRNGRGRELGTVPGSLLSTTFKEQTKKWEPLVTSHVSDAVCVVHHFIRQLLQIACPEQTVREELWDSVLLEKIRRCYKRAMKHAHLILENERDCPPMTLNHYFTSNLEKDRINRLVDSLKDMFSFAVSQDYEYADSRDGIHVTEDCIKSLRSDKSIAEHTRDEIHDVLKSYYKVARKRIVDNVCQQVIECFLLSGKKSPLRVFSNETVNRMTVDQLEMIAGEDSGTKTQRKYLETQIERLEAAMAVLRG